MTAECFSGPTLDDVLHDAIDALQDHGLSIRPGKGSAKELVGVLLEVTNPRARLSRTETRGRPFSCLGELCWYLAGSNKLDFISYYIPRYKAYAENNIIYGGYGPRLFGWKGLDQFANVTSLLRERPDSRRAVVQLFDSTDIVEPHEDVPCTCTLQFMLRGDKLHLFTSMRSNDVYLGLPHDMFSFTMLQEIMARCLSVDLGVYKHAAGSLHLYDRNRDAAQCFLAEGWQSTEMSMPPMPTGDPWPAIRSMLEAESQIRSGNSFDLGILNTEDPYWADLIRLLLVHRFKKDKVPDKIVTLAAAMSSPIYRQFLEQLIRRVTP